VLGSRVKLADLPSVSVSLIFLLAGLLLGEWEEPVGEISVDDLCVGEGETREPYSETK
jgi:D-aminopeptidase